jgi:hypothetical protein
MAATPLGCGVVRRIGGWVGRRFPGPAAGGEPRAGGGTGARAAAIREPEAAATGGNDSFPFPDRFMSPLG